MCLDFVPLELILDVAKSMHIELASPCAIIGGFLGQEVLKVLAKKDVPIDNFFLHDALTPVAFRMHISSS